MLTDNSFPSSLHYAPSAGKLVLAASPLARPVAHLHPGTFDPTAVAYRDPRCKRACCKPDESLERAFDWIDRVVGMGRAA
jgi:hypothetical protein